MPLGFRPLATSPIGVGLLKHFPGIATESFDTVTLSATSDADQLLGETLNVTLGCTMDADITAAPEAANRPTDWTPEAPQLENVWATEPSMVANPSGRN